MYLDNEAKKHLYSFMIEVIFLFVPHKQVHHPNIYTLTFEIRYDKNHSRCSILQKRTF